MKEEGQQRLDLVGRAGVLLWTLGMAALLYNVWLMRSWSSELVLWIAAPPAVVVGGLIAAYSRSRRLPDIGFRGSLAGFVGGGFGVVLFFWLTAVSPTTSASGKRATEFFAAIAADEMDAAYEMLSEEAKSKIPREEFEQHLPPNYRVQKGSTINGVGGSVGTAVGDSDCVEGWLDVPDGMDSRFDIGLVEDGDGVMRIHTLVRESRCVRP
jgi:hypothetical protein